MGRLSIRTIGGNIATDSSNDWRSLFYAGKLLKRYNRERMTWMKKVG